jgi:ankyrin repeat protein
MDAAKSGDLSVVKELLKRGATVNARHRYGTTALMDAAYGGHLKVVKELLNRRANISNALRQAVIRGHVPIIKELLRRGASINATLINNARNQLNNRVVAELLGELNRGKAASIKALSNMQVGNNMRHLPHNLVRKIMQS